MGQQETVAGTALRRMTLVLAVAVLMAAMMAVSAMPAMAKNTGEQPPGPPKQNFSLTGNNNANVQHCQTFIPGADPGTNVFTQKQTKISCGS